MILVVPQWLNYLNFPTFSKKKQMPIQHQSLHQSIISQSVSDMKRNLEQSITNYDHSYT